MKRKRRLQMEQVLRVLPEVDEMDALREALVEGSHPDRAQAWSGSEALLTLDKRVIEPADLEARIPELAERGRERGERVFRRVTAALRALQEDDAAQAAREMVAAGEVEEEARRLEQAWRYYEKALELGRRPRDRAPEGLALRRMGRVARARGDLPRALRLYREGYEVARAQRDDEGAVVGCQGMGNVLGELGRWEEAREWFERGLALAQAWPRSALHWQLFNNLSIVETRAGRVERGEEWLERAAGVVAELEDAAGRVFVENTRGRLLLARGRVAEAETSFRTALGHATDAFHRVTVLVNLAEALVAQGRLREAEEAARRAEEVAIARRVPTKLADVYRLLGVVARERGDGEAFLFFEQALEACAAFHLPAVEVGAIQHQYALFEERSGQSAAARERLRRAVETFRELGAGPELERAEADLARLERSGTDRDPG